MIDDLTRREAARVLRMGALTRMGFYATVAALAVGVDVVLFSSIGIGVAFADGVHQYRVATRLMGGR